jgi:hypothetical protein
MNAPIITVCLVFLHFYFSVLTNSPGLFNRLFSPQSAIKKKKNRKIYEKEKKSKNRSSFLNCFSKSRRESSGTLKTGKRKNQIAFFSELEKIKNRGY